jgi:hypothetical protein
VRAGADVQNFVLNGDETQDSQQLTNYFHSHSSTVSCD